MQKTILFLFIFIVGMLVYSCKKNLPPVITMTKPVMNDVYTSGGEVNIDGEVTDEDGLLSGYVSAINMSDSSVVYRYNITLTDPLIFAIHKHFVPVVTDTTLMKVYISMKDKKGEISKEEIDIRVNP